MLTKESVKTIQAAQKQVLDGKLTIWNTRLDALVSAGDVRGALDQLVSPVADVADNCGCNVQCGAMTNPMDAITNPVKR